MDPETPDTAAPFGVPLTDVAGLARRLGVAPSTIHSWVQQRAPFLPPPERLAGRFVWLTEQLDGVEERVAQRPRRGNPAWSAQARARRETADGPDATV